MHKFDIKLHTFIFEIKYSYGYLYIDRCGQTLIDIERLNEDWIASTPDLSQGRLDKPEKHYRLSFSSQSFNFTVSKAFLNDIPSIIKEIKKTWKIVQANFGLEEYTRIGYRLEYLLPTMSIEDADKKVKKSKLNKPIYTAFESTYNIEKASILTTLLNNNIEYRIQLQSITQVDSIDSLKIIKGNPRAMSKNQEKIRLSQLQQLKDYSASPRYSVLLDVDCVEYLPKSLSIENYILNQTKIVEQDFLPLLEEL